MGRFPKPENAVAWRFLAGLDLEQFTADGQAVERPATCRPARHGCSLPKGERPRRPKRLPRVKPVLDDLDMAVWQPMES